MNDKGTQPRTGFPYLNAAAVMSSHIFSTPFVLSFVVCFAVHVMFFVCVVLVFGNEKQPLLLGVRVWVGTFLKWTVAWVLVVTF